MMNILILRSYVGIGLILLSLIACERDEPVKNLLITTGDITVFAEGIYIFRGTIVGIGEQEISKYGFCWSKSADPVVDESSICLGTTNHEGSFSYTVYDFEANTTYYVRAFAIAGSTIFYGEEKSFTTPEILVPIVVDIDKNIYYSVTIGDQVWMSDNLKATRYPDGSLIPHVEDQQAWFNFVMYSQAYCWYENYGAIGATYGALYTWPAAMHIISEDDIKPGNVQGVCPDGWHLPSDSEWKQLEMYLGMSFVESDEEGWRGTDEGGKMKHQGTVHWQAPNTGATNESNLTALPSGWRDGAGYFNNLGTATRFWSSSKRGDYAWIRELDNNSSQIFRTTKGLYEGISVRCIKDK
jgi:uncharacterized protein (TIGR02145 family)